MKIYKIIILILSELILSFGCRMKEACELNHSGEIFITNKTGETVDVFVENLKVFTLENLETKSIERPVGNYHVKCLNFPNEWEQTVIVEECKSTKLQFPEIED